MTQCRTWSITGDKRVTGKCSMQLLMETERIMKNGCPVCANANAIVGPIGCCGCTGEVFPGIWDFDSPFSIGGDYHIPEVVSVTGSASEWPCLGNVTPPGSGYATATTTQYRTPLSDIQGHPLIRVMSTGGTPGCAWGYGESTYDGFIFYPTYGNPSGVAPGSCPLTRGYTELRCSYSHAGPYYRANGSSAVGNPFGAHFRPFNTYEWSNVPESGYDGESLGSVLGAFLITLPCGSYPNNTKLGSLLVGSICWNWHLTCISLGGGGPQTLRLLLNSFSYSLITLDKMIGVPSFSGSTWVHDGIGASPCGTTFDGLVAIQGHPVIGASWTATYPCNQPDTITLTNPYPIGIGSNAGLTFPETITLRAVY